MTFGQTKPKPESKEDNNKPKNLFDNKLKQDA